MRSPEGAGPAGAEHRRRESPAPSGFLRALDRLCAVLGRALDVFLVVGGGGVTAVVLANVVARYVFNISLAWVNEMGEFTLLWLTFLGGARALQLGAHLSITELVEAAGPRLQRALRWVAEATAAAVLLAMLVWGTSLSRQMMGQTLSVTYIPMGLAYAAMPVGAVLGLLFIARRVLLGPEDAPLAEGHAE